MEYRKGNLVEDNQWEHLSYQFNGEWIDPETIKRLIVEFPDGVTGSIPTVVVDRSVDYPDMGKTYTAKSRQLFGEVSYHGMALRVSISKLAITAIYVDKDTPRRKASFQKNEIPDYEDLPEVRSDTESNDTKGE